MSLKSKKEEKPEAAPKWAPNLFRPQQNPMRNSLANKHQFQAFLQLSRGSSENRCDTQNELFSVF